MGWYYYCMCRVGKEKTALFIIHYSAKYAKVEANDSLPVGSIPVRIPDQLLFSLLFFFSLFLLYYYYYYDYYYYSLTVSILESGASMSQGVCLIIKYLASTDLF